MTLTRPGNKSEVAALKEGPRKQLVSHDLLREQVMDVILERIMNGTYAPDQRLIEREIAGELGVSQGTIREALRQLEGMGFVNSRPYKGSRVRVLSREDLIEAYPVRAALEELAAVYGAEHITDLMLRSLEHELNGIRECAAHGNQQGVAIHDAEFHRILVQASKNRALIDAWNALQVRARTIVTAVASNLQLNNIADMHLPILKAAEARDSVALATEMRLHIERFQSLISEQGIRHDRSAATTTAKRS